MIQIGETESTYTYEGLAIRQEGLGHPSPCVVIKVVANKELGELSPEQIIELVRKAVTEWAKTSEEGRLVYEYAGDDMNIGDLVSHGELGEDGVKDEALKIALEAVGIIGFFAEQR